MRVDLILCDVRQSSRPRRMGSAFAGSNASLKNVSGHLLQNYCVFHCTLDSFASNIHVQYYVLCACELQTGWLAIPQADAGLKFCRRQKLLEWDGQRFIFVVSITSNIALQARWGLSSSTKWGTACGDDCPGCHWVCKVYRHRPAQGVIPPQNSRWALRNVSVLRMQLCAQNAYLLRKPRHAWFEAKWRWCARVAEQGLTAPLPAGWSEHKDKDGNIFYHHAGAHIICSSYNLTTTSTAIYIRCLHEKYIPCNECVSMIFL